MKRRMFLKQLSAILASSVGYAGVSEAFASDPHLSKKRIVVIGAGLAGLAAASELHKQGHDVLVLEGRERIGGRIWTSQKWSNIPLDLGATWIHGVEGNPITQLADTINAKRIETSYEHAEAYGTDGHPLSTAEENELDQFRNQVAKVIRQSQDVDPDVSIQQALEPLLSQFPASSDAHKYIKFILSAEIEQEYGGSASQLSTHWFDSDKELHGGDVLFKEGYRVIIEHLAQGLTIQLGQQVKEIHWGESTTRISTQQSQFDADHVIVTLPLGVLKSKQVRFVPELPQPKQSAISLIGMGVLNKCYLQFAECFWPDDVDWLEYIPEKHGEWTEWVSFKRAANLPVLLGFNAADRGREIESLSDAQIVASAMRTLRTLYGADIPEPIDYQITRWASDPFALGSYSFNAVGTSPRTRQELGASLNKTVFFAGEATSQHYFGTAHGAYLSGIDAAKQVSATKA